jgi:hypothetical protein
MWRRKIILGAIPLALIAVLAIFRMLPKGPALAWKVVRIQPSGPYWVRDGMEPHCWSVEIEVINLTSGEVIVDWNRDKTAFQVAGRWEDLGLSAMMPYLGPNASRTFSLAIPQRAQACRIRMYYENGPLWSTVDQYLKNHGICAPDKLFIPAMKLNQKLPGHFRRLDIQVQIPPKIFGFGEIRMAHNPCVQTTPDCALLFALAQVSGAPDAGR